MDRAGEVLAQDLPPNMRISYAALAKQGGVPRFILHHRGIRTTLEGTEGSKLTVYVPIRREGVLEVFVTNV
jgi:hypothetical protein